MMLMKRVCALALLVGLVSLATTKSVAAPPAPARQEKKAEGEHHPHIRAAIRELQEARHELETAAHDFGGHRVKAMQAIDNAIKQLREGLEYDKK